MIPASTLLLKVQQEILNVLKRDSVLSSKVTAILDRVPTSGSVTTPYVALEGGDIIPNQMMSGSGVKVFIVLCVYSSAPGYEELLNILMEIERILRNQAITIEEYGKSMCEIEASKTSYANSVYQTSMNISLNF